MILVNDLELEPSLADGIDALGSEARSRKPLIRIELDDLFPTLFPVYLGVDLGSMARERESERIGASRCMQETAG